MDREELLAEQKASKKFFRLTTGGNFKDFDTLPDLIDYLLNTWDDDSYFASIRRLATIPEKVAYKGK